MTFMLPLDLVDEPDRAQLAAAARGAQASGTPWISFFSPEEILSVATEAGFTDVRLVPTADIADRYLTGRADGLQPATGETMLITRT